MNPGIANPNTEASILSRVLDLPHDHLTPAAAEFLLSIRFSETDIVRMNDLSERARQGALAPEEESELDSYLHVSNLLALLQSRARRALRSPART